MRVSIAIMVILSYPLQLDPSRRCLTSLINAQKKKYQQRRNHEREEESQQQQQQQQQYHHSDNNDEDDEMFYSLASNDTQSRDQQQQDLEGSLALSSSLSPSMEQKENNHFLFNVITCCFLLFSFIVAMSVSDLGVVLGIVGATGSTIVSYILPGTYVIEDDCMCVFPVTDLKRNNIGIIKTVIFIIMPNYC